MPTPEDLPDGFSAPTRTEIRDGYQRDVQLRQPGAPTGEGSQAFVDGSVLADALLPIYANSVSIARGANLEDMTLAQLNAECRALGIPEQMPATAGGGFVLIGASAGGVFINESRELRDEGRNLRYRCAVADTYFNGRAVPIIGVDTGPTTNIPAGTRLRWTNPPAGLASIAEVQEDADGNGLLGGRSQETETDIAARITEAKANQPAGGNVAQIRKLVREAGRTLGIAVQEVFVYPCITGPGHYAYVFTLRPGSPGSSRIPNAVQIAAVRAYIHRTMPEDDGIFAAEIIAEEIDGVLGVRWTKQSGVGWVDAQPWPQYVDQYEVDAVTSATAFDVISGESSPTVPEVGKTMAFYDAQNGKFARKRILTATSMGGGVYAITVDTSNDASDVNYVPSVGERMCPYSPSLDLLVEPMLLEMDKLGPGEMADDFFDEGYRQKRDPEDPTEWPSEIRHVSLDAVDELPQLRDVEWLEPEDIPAAPSVGVAGVSVNLLEFATILAFPS